MLSPCGRARRGPPDWHLCRVRGATHRSRSGDRSLGSGRSVQGHGDGAPGAVVAVTGGDSGRGRGPAPRPRRRNSCDHGRSREEHDIDQVLVREASFRWFSDRLTERWKSRPRDQYRMLTDARGSRQHARRLIWSSFLLRTTRARSELRSLADVAGSSRSGARTCLPGPEVRRSALRRRPPATLSSAEFRSTHRSNHGRGRPYSSRDRGARSLLRSLPFPARAR